MFVCCSVLTVPFPTISPHFSPHLSPHLSPRLDWQPTTFHVEKDCVCHVQSKPQRCHVKYKQHWHRWRSQHRGRSSPRKRRCVVHDKRCVQVRTCDVCIGLRTLQRIGRDASLHNLGRSLLVHVFVHETTIGRQVSEWCWGTLVD